MKRLHRDTYICRYTTAVVSVYVGLIEKQTENSRKNIFLRTLKIKFFTYFRSSEYQHTNFQILIELELNLSRNDLELN